MSQTQKRTKQCANRRWESSSWEQKVSQKNGMWKESIKGVNTIKMLQHMSDDVSSKPLSLIKTS